MYMHVFFDITYYACVCNFISLFNALMTASLNLHKQTYAHTYLLCLHFNKEKFLLGVICNKPTITSYHINTATLSQVLLVVAAMGAVNRDVVLSVSVVLSVVSLVLLFGVTWYFQSSFVILQRQVEYDRELLFKLQEQINVITSHLLYTVNQLYD